MSKLRIARNKTRILVGQVMSVGHSLQKRNNNADYPVQMKSIVIFMHTLKVLKVLIVGWVVTSNKTLSLPFNLWILWRMSP